jgi:hypothetical protein
MVRDLRGAHVAAGISASRAREAVLPNRPVCNSGRTPPQYIGTHKYNGFFRGLGCDVCCPTRSTADRDVYLCALRRRRGDPSGHRHGATTAARAFVNGVPDFAHLNSYRNRHRNLGQPRAWAINQHFAASPTPCDAGTLCLRPTSPLSW